MRTGPVRPIPGGNSNSIRETLRSWMGSCEGAAGTGAAWSLTL